MYCQKNHKLTSLSIEKALRDVSKNIHSSQLLNMPQSMKTKKTWIASLYLNPPLFLNYFQVIKETVRLIFANGFKIA